MKTQISETKRASPFLRRLYGYGSASLVFAALLMIGAFSLTYKYAYVRATPEGALTAAQKQIPPFPLGVNPKEESILENPSVDSYFYDQLSNKKDEPGTFSSLMQPLLGKLALLSVYQNLASVSTRILVIEPGERKEQVSEHFGKILEWTDDEKREFLATVVSSEPILFEGKFAPGTYVAARDAKPYEVALLVSDRFSESVVSRYPDQIQNVIPLHDTLVIASLLEREAYDFEDMRYIAGIIWNRLFADMKLQIDATLQYAKGEKSVKSWWPRVIPSDKYIESAFNTYQNEGLPPAPIANPSANAILAALNPRHTDCMYYFHDRKGGFHCSKTYEEHVALLKGYYGQGK
jgi:cell division protein YceG involved in septum cleavage